MPLKAQGPGPTKGVAFVPPRLVPMIALTPQLIPSRSMKTSVAKMGPLGRFSRHACTTWASRLEQVKAFTLREGHCRIPQVYAKNPDLGKWAKRQRYHYQRFIKKVAGKCHLTDERVAALDEVGFCWGIHIETWEEMYQQLVRFVQVSGHARVPTAESGKHKVLGIWVKKQRRIFQTGLKEGAKHRMDVERFHRLDALGFDWQLSRSPERERKLKKEGKMEANPK